MSEAEEVLHVLRAQFPKVRIVAEPEGGYLSGLRKEATWRLPVAMLLAFLWGAVVISVAAPAF